jgi:hypothetical protein
MKRLPISIFAAVCCSFLVVSCGGGETSSVNNSNLASSPVTSASPAIPASSATAVTSADTTEAPVAAAPAQDLAISEARARTENQKWVRLEANLAVDTVSSVLDRVRAAKAAGANTAMFSDAKINLWFVSDSLAAQWLRKMKELASGIRAQGMRLILQTVPVGYCTSLLYSDPNLTTGYPIIDAPFTVRSGALVPDQSAVLDNGSFENATDNLPLGWSVDSPGLATFVDSSVKQAGTASIRFEPKDAPNNQARAFASLNVKPNQQYTLRFWVKTENLTANYLGPYIIDQATNQRLSDQHYSYGDENSRQYYGSMKGVTKDWTEMVIAFNSLNATNVTLAFGAWGGSGKLWVDNARIETTPLLNVIRRDNLPVAARTADGRVLIEATDISPFVDTKAGQYGYTGNFDTYHAAPAVSLPKTTRLVEGDRVLISAYHALVTTGAQVGCSWHDPKLLALMKEVHR